MTPKYAFLIARREYIENARTKGFWLGIFLVPLIMFVSVQIPILLDKKGTPTRHYVLVDQSGNFAAAVETHIEHGHQRRVLSGLNEYARKNSAAPIGAGDSDPLSEFQTVNAQTVEAFIRKGGKDFYLAQLKPRLQPNAPEFHEPRRIFQRIELPARFNAAADLPSLARELRPYVRGAEQMESHRGPVTLHAAILIPADIDQQVFRPAGSGDRAANGPNGIEYWSGNLADTRLREQVEEVINREIRQREYVTRGMDVVAIRQVERTYAPFTSLNPKKEAGQETVRSADIIRQWAPSLLVYLLWVAIFSIMQMLLNNIVEEKSNRIIEVLLSSVTPGELMLGKLFGIAAVGMTMISAWLGSLFGILLLKVGSGNEVTGQMFAVLKGTNLIPIFAVYFLFGYLMYAGVILSVGSICNTIKEAQNYVGVITMVMIVPLLTLTFIPRDPNGTVARFLSWVPPYTPFTMMNRATSDPPLFDLIGTMILMVVCTGLSLWMAGKIFRIGVLRTGQPPKIVEMIRWIRG